MAVSADHLKRMRELIDLSGIRAVLVYLNQLTDHRFTALYRFDNDQLRSVYFYDRERPELELCPDIPVLASYCVFVRSSAQTFVTPDATNDDRTTEHPKRLEVRSYCGVPLVDHSGRPFGSVCHFDPRPLTISDETVALMEALPTLLTDFSAELHGPSAGAAPDEAVAIG